MKLLKHSMLSFDWQHETYEKYQAVSHFIKNTFFE